MESTRIQGVKSAMEVRTIVLHIRVVGTASTPRLLDILMDPISLHAQGVLDYSSRDLVISVGERE